MLGEAGRFRHSVSAVTQVSRSRRNRHDRQHRHAAPKAPAGQPPFYGTCLVESHSPCALADSPEPRIIYGLFRTHDLPPILRSYLQLVRQSIDRTPGMTAYEDSWEKLIPTKA